MHYGGSRRLANPYVYDEGSGAGFVTSSLAPDSVSRPMEFEVTRNEDIEDKIHSQSRLASKSLLH